MKRKLINEGCSRKVYDLLNGTVIKIAKNKRGQVECENELYIYNNTPDNFKKLLCPILEFNGKGVIMSKVEILSSDYNIEKLLEELKDFINFLVNTFNIDDFDLSCYFNWGKLNGEIVLIDYGHNYFNDSLHVT